MSESPRKRIDGRETMERIVEFAERELAEYGVSGFNLSRVIEQSGVSRGSVYHHFINREGTIAAVETKRLLEDLDNANKILREFANSASHIDEIMYGVRVLLESTSSEEARENRRRRNVTTVNAQAIPILAQVMSQREAEGDAHVAETIRLTTERGIIHPRLPAVGIAHFISSLFSGRLVVDLLNNPEADTAWIDVTLEALRHLLSPATD
jgi:AcrR family transcriptional regulator